MDHVATGSLNRLAVRATTHCLTGCAIGEVLGLVIGTALGLATLATLAIAIGLAFFFGYALTMRPLIGSGDNAILLVIPGAMDAGLADPLFWGSLAVALGIAWVVAFPVNRWLIARGRGHAVVHGAHGDDHDPASGGHLR
jgi:hypothetical protein